MVANVFSNLGAGGGLGHLAVQIAARAMGYRVIGIDHSSKKDLVTKSGAEHFFGIDTEDDVVKAVMGVTGGVGARAAIVVVSINVPLSICNISSPDCQQSRY